MSQEQRTKSVNSISSVSKLNSPILLIDQSNLIRSRKQLAKDGINVNDCIDQLTDDQKNWARQAFSSYDIFGTGMVAIGDLRNLLRTLGFNPTEDEIEDVINEYECEDVVEFDFTELLYILAPLLVKGNTEQELSEIIRVLDPLRTGAVELMELRSLLEQLRETSMHDMTSEEIDFMLEFLDQDQDGLLSLEDFKWAIEVYQH